MASTVESQVHQAFSDNHVQSMLVHIDSREQETAERLIPFITVASPSGNEHDRAELVGKQMRELGLDDVKVSEVNNAVGVLRGRETGLATALVSTLDDLPSTVQAHHDAVRAPYLDMEARRVVGPGADHASSVGSMIAVASAMIAHGYSPRRDIVFAAVSDEEGEQRGMKALCSDYGNRVAAFIDILGDGSEAIWFGAIGKRQWQIQAHAVHCDPVHTLKTGAYPINVLQAIGAAADRISALQATLPRMLDDSSLKINVTQLHGGIDMNHRPARGWFAIDVRSLKQTVLDCADKAVMAVLDGISEETSIRFAERNPSSAVAPARIEGRKQAYQRHLADLSKAVAEYLGITPRDFSENGSGNYKVAILSDIPAIGVYGVRGGNVGTIGEFADMQAMTRAAKHMLLLIAALQL